MLEAKEFKKKNEIGDQVMLDAVVRTAAVPF